MLALPLTSKYRAGGARYGQAAAKLYAAMVFKSGFMGALGAALDASVNYNVAVSEIFRL